MLPPEFEGIGRALQKANMKYAFLVAATAGPIFAPAAYFGQASTPIGVVGRAVAG
jgi:hypothetical protein